jgi:hypothetical protein
MIRLQPENPKWVLKWGCIILFLRISIISWANHIMLAGMVSPRTNEDRLIVTSVYRESDQTCYSGAFRIESDHSSIVMHDILYFLRYLSANIATYTCFWTRDSLSGYGVMKMTELSALSMWSFNAWMLSQPRIRECLIMALTWNLMSWLKMVGKHIRRLHFWHHWHRCVQWLWKYLLGQQENS